MIYFVRFFNIKILLPAVSILFRFRCVTHFIVH